MDIDKHILYQNAFRLADYFVNLKETDRRRLDILITIQVEALRSFLLLCPLVISFCSWYVSTEIIP